MGLTSLGVSNSSIFSDQVDCPDVPEGAPGVVELCYLSARIGQKREGKLVPRSKSGVTLRSRRIHPKHDRIARGCERSLITEFAELLGANGRVVGRVEDQHDVFLAETGKCNRPTILIHEREVRCESAYS
jgi:hypothetical protein